MLFQIYWDGKKYLAHYCYTIIYKYKCDATTGKPITLMHCAECLALSAVYSYPDKVYKANKLSAIISGIYTLCASDGFLWVDNNASCKILQSDLSIRYPSLKLYLNWKTIMPTNHSFEEVVR